MKLTKLLTSLLLAVTIAIPVHLTGCGSLPERPPQTVALDSLRTTYDTTREAYKGALKLYLVGKVAEDKKLELDKIWNDFRAATTLAVESTTLGWSAPTPESVLAFKTKLLLFIKSL